MARDIADLMIQRTFEQQFEQLATSLGASSVDALTDQEHRIVANEVIRTNLPTLYHGQVLAEGSGIDPTALPGFAQKLASVGATHAEEREFAMATYPDLDPRDAVKRYQRDIQQAGGGTAEENAAAKTKRVAESRFDRPF